MENPIELERVANLRDVGKTVNRFLGRKLVREGVFFRSARLDHASPKDKAFLRDEIGIKTVLDLRTKTEIARSAAKHEERVATSRLKSPSAVIEPLQIEGVTYREIHITGRRLERFLLSFLSWWSFIKLIFLHLLGHRLEAIRIVTQEAMNPRGLLMLGNDTLDLSGPDIREALEVYAKPEAMPTLVHCTHGKDRTGLVCMLVLMILGVPTEAIEYDYHLTDISVKENMQLRLKEVREIGLDDDWIYTAPKQISVAEAHIKERYGGLGPYLEYIGLDEATQAQIRQALLY